MDLVCTKLSYIRLFEFYSIDDMIALKKIDFVDNSHQRFDNIFDSLLFNVVAHQSPTNTFIQK